MAWNTHNFSTQSSSGFADTHLDSITEQSLPAPAAK